MGADAAVQPVAVYLQRAHEPATGLARVDHGLRVVKSGQVPRRGVVLYLGEQFLEALGVFVLGDAVNHVDRKPGVHEAQIGGGPGDHLVRVPPAAHVEIGLAVALANDHRDLGDARQ